MKKGKWLTYAAIAVAFMIGAVTFGFRPRAAQAEEADVRYIDMYLIAGQSNAAGYSAAPNPGETFANVRYAGQVNRKINQTAGTNDSVNAILDGVTKGLGRSATHIGPEYGMACVLNDMYTPDNKALLFKTAAGGTSIRNIDSGESADFGNWCPPSKRTSTNAATGVMYDRFVENFATVVDRLKTEGFTPRVCGMAWMQGETDRYYTADFKAHFSAFVADIRTDLSAIAETDLSTMPIVMGEISETFSAYDQKSVNQAFNDALHKLADSLENVGYIESGKFVINTATATVGTDRYHWNTGDMTQIGKLFAQKILDLAPRKTVAPNDTAGTLSFTRGSVAYTVTDGVLTLTPHPHTGCVLGTLSVNGNRVTLSEGSYSMPLTAAAVIEADFVAAREFILNYKINASKGAFVGTPPRTVYEGDVLELKISCKEGYSVDSVTMGDAALTYHADTDSYVSAPITANATVRVNFRDPTPCPDEQNPSQGGTDNTEQPSSAPSKKGCGSELAAALSLLSAVGIGLLFIKRV